MKKTEFNWAGLFATGASLFSILIILESQQPASTSHAGIYALTALALALLAVPFAWPKKHNS